MLHFLLELIHCIHCFAKHSERSNEQRQVVQVAVPQQQYQQVYVFHQSHHVIPNRYPVYVRGRQVVTDPESTKPLLPQPTY